MMMFPYTVFKTQNEVKFIETILKGFGGLDPMFVAKVDAWQGKQLGISTAPLSAVWPTAEQLEKIQRIILF